MGAVTASVGRHVARARIERGAYGLWGAYTEIEAAPGSQPAAPIWIPWGGSSRVPSEHDVASAAVWRALRAALHEEAGCSATCWEGQVVVGGGRWTIEVALPRDDRPPSGVGEVVPVADRDWLDACARRPRRVGEREVEPARFAVALDCLLGKRVRLVRAGAVKAMVEAGRRARLVRAAAAWVERDVRRAEALRRADPKLREAAIDVALSMWEGWFNDEIYAWDVRVQGEGETFEQRACGPYYAASGLALAIDEAASVVARWVGARAPMDGAPRAHDGVLFEAQANANVGVQACLP